VLLVNAVVIMLFRSIGARIPDRMGPLRTARVAMSFAPAGLLIMGLWRSVPGLFVGAIVLACGQALAFPALMTVAVGSAPANERGSVMGTFTAFFDLSFGGGVLTLGVISEAIGYNGAFIVAGAVAAIGLAVVTLAPPRVPTTRPAVPVLDIEPPGE
jgi:predicted MFS family arabinose efflux permease